MTTSAPESPPGEKLRLVLLSFVVLFVELALIRWTGSNVVYLSYFSNFVLLGSFLGIGVGFLRARAKRNLFPWAPVALVLLVAFVLFFPVQIDRSGSELLYFGELTRSGLPPWATLPILFLLVALTMAMLAEGLARSFVQFAPLDAYRLDLLGSLAGIGGFSLLSFLQFPPLAWGLVVALALALLGRMSRLVPAVALLALVGLLGWESGQARESWSPYYKVTLEPLSQQAYRVWVNGIPHQVIQSIEARRRSEPIYFLPYVRRPAGSLDRVLVVGAGNGTDVAIALAQGAKQVDAVEIDPRLQELGAELQPDRPYQDPRVHAHITDGRAFLENNDDKYDLILFALPDSLTLVAGQSSLRLESYLFTLEAMEKARDHLAPGGAFAMYNYYREQWLIDRLAHTLEVVYGHPPCLDSVGGSGRLALLTTARDSESLRCDTRWSPTVGAPPAAARDDYPFLYLRTPHIPGFYLLTIALILATAVVVVRLTAGPFRSMASYVDLFFMGAAFLLLETKSVVQFALLFGTTWFVNALVFAGILLSVLAAVEVARRYRPKQPLWLYALLLASLAVAWAVPQHALLSLSGVPRFLAATALAFTPIFLANLVFSTRFRDVTSSHIAFGANLLGAMVGGVLEYFSLIVGYRFLLVIVALLYGLAFLFGRRHLRTVQTTSLAKTAASGTSTRASQEA
jgi:Spermine/spermidine synthase domain